MLPLLAALLACTGATEPPPAADLEAIVLRASRTAGDGSLVLADRAVTDEILAAVLADPGVPALHSVTLTGNRIGPAGLDALLGSEKVRELRWLNLSGNPLGDEGLRRLAAAQALAGVERLFITGVGAGADGIRALAASPHAGALRSLAAGDQPVGDAGAASLITLDGLRELALPRAQIGGEGARALIEGGAAASLNLEGNPVGPGGLVGLRRFAPGLEQLNLRATGLDLDDLRALAALESAGDLRELVLQDNPFGDEGIAIVGQIPWLQDLEKLQIEGSGCGKEARARMRKDWGTRGGLKIEPR